MKKIGFIGFGRMAEAIYKGLVKTDFETRVCFAEKNIERANYIKETYQLNQISIQEVVNSVDLLFFAVKPQGFDEVVNEINKVSQLELPLMVSIMAGISSENIYNAFGSQSKFIRLMPNTPCLLGEGMTGMYSNNNVTIEEKNVVETIFNTLGKTLLVQNEEDLDIVTGISGSGPAFLYQLASYVGGIAKQSSLSESEVITLFSQTMVGAGKMLLETEHSAEHLIEQVSSPGGTTVAGLEVLKKSNVKHDLTAVITAAIERSKELGK